MAEYFYTIDLGPVFGPRLQKLAAQHGADVDVEAFAANLMCAAIEACERREDEEMERIMKELENFEIPDGTDGENRSEIDDGIPF